ncbi:MAG: hypothetical protein K5790_10275 [Nitrosopumilus sp.]|nr:hypothetical protein [Nitrosopumilus sp.]MCV0393655.1 hypothetical protein [Nitrosopumilus sp.]
MISKKSFNELEKIAKLPSTDYEDYKRIMRLLKKTKIRKSLGRLSEIL